MEEDSVGLAGLTELSFEAVQSFLVFAVGTGPGILGTGGSRARQSSAGLLGVPVGGSGWDTGEAALDTICPVVGKPERSSVHLRFYLQEVGTASITMVQNLDPTDCFALGGIGHTL